MLTSPAGSRLLLALAVSLHVTLAQTPQVSSVVNLASGEELLAPGVLARIFGRNLGLAQPSTVPVSILVNGAEAAVLDWNPERVRAADSRSPLCFQTSCASSASKSS